MASARGRKGKTQQGRRPQKGMRQKSRGKISLAKQRKHQGKAKRQRVDKQRKRALKQFFHSVNAKMLNQIKRDDQFLSQEAKWLMIRFMENIYKQVSSDAERLRRKSRDALVRPVHIQVTLQRVVPKRRLRPVPAAVSRNRR